MSKLHSHGSPICALTHCEVQLPPFPYETALSCRPLKAALDSPEYRFLLDQHASRVDLGHGGDHCDAEAIQSMRWMLTPWMPFAELSGQWMGVSTPFHLDMLLAQEGFKQRFLDRDGNLGVRSHLDVESLQRSRVLKAIEWILHKVYQRDQGFDPSVVFVKPDETSGLERYYQFRFDPRFVDVECRGHCPIIRDSDLESLSLASRSGLDEWLKMFPPDRFLFKGFSMVSAVDVTAKEAQSGLIRELQRGTVIDADRLQRMERYIQILGQSKGVCLRVFVHMSDRLLLLNPKANGGACVMSNSLPMSTRALSGTPYVKVLKGEDQVWMKKHQLPGMLGEVSRHIGDEVLLMGLGVDGHTIGVMEVSAPERRCLQGIDPFSMVEICHAVAEAVQKGLDQLEQRVQRVIQENCTALHRSVRWRFDLEARSVLEGGSVAQFDDIVFDQVYPLFSQSDIQSSSHFRNEAIRSDLKQQLEMARVVLEAMQEVRELPIVGEMMFQLDAMMDRLSDGLHSSDEYSIQQFLKFKVEKVFRELIAAKSRAQECFEVYRSALDARFGMIHRERERYEASVKQLNRMISEMMDVEQEAAQDMIPHYAEKNMTDGVELSMYAGASLLNGHDWSDLHLSNLRLWQLILTCRIARKCLEVEDQLPLPLKMTHLILVQDMPLTIRFSTEEKEFVVDGAYNIRYAIIKKRIDKALVAGRDQERLTQAGQIAVVYSHVNEAEQYRDFFAYVHRLGLIEEKVEELELQDLQSLSGMKAMRVTVIPERRRASRGPEPSATELTGALIH